MKQGCLWDKENAKIKIYRLKSNRSVVGHFQTSYRYEFSQRLPVYHRELYIIVSNFDNDQKAVYAAVANNDTCLWYSMEITVKDPESGIGSIHYRIVDRRNNNSVVLEGNAEVRTRYAPGSKRRKRVRRKQDY